MTTNPDYMATDNDGEFLQGSNLTCWQNIRERHRRSCFLSLVVVLALSDISREGLEWDMVGRGGIKSQISKPNTVGIGLGLGCQPQRVSESKGQPSVVIGLPRLETNYRVQAFQCSARGNVCVCVCICMCARVCMHFCVICFISGCGSLHNPLIRCINGGLSMLIHPHSHMFGCIF